MRRKGITPVIAVVLLLLITVGAVASAWGLYQEVTSDKGQLDQLQAKQQAQQTNIKVQSIYKSDDGYVNVSLRNNGGVPVNLTEDVELLVDPDGTSEYLPDNLLDSAEISESNCFGGSGVVMTTKGDRKEIQCNTTIEFPQAGQTAGFRIEYKDVENTYWDFSCQPSSSSSTLCG